MDLRRSRRTAAVLAAGLTLLPIAGRAAAAPAGDPSEGTNQRVAPLRWFRDPGRPTLVDQRDRPDRVARWPLRGVLDGRCAGPRRHERPQGRLRPGHRGSPHDPGQRRGGRAGWQRRQLAADDLLLRPAGRVHHGRDQPGAGQQRPRPRRRGEGPVRERHVARIAALRRSPGGPQQLRSGAVRGRGRRGLREPGPVGGQGRRRPARRLCARRVRAHPADVARQAEPQLHRTGTGGRRVLRRLLGGARNAGTVWLRDVNRFATRTIWHEEGSGSAGRPTISGDGRFAAFSTRSTAIVAGERGSWSDVFRVHLPTGSVTKVSVRPSGGSPKEDSFSPSLSYSGRYVAFSSFAGGLAPNDAVDHDVFVRDMRTATTSPGVERVRRRRCGLGQRWPAGPSSTTAGGRSSTSPTRPTSCGRTRTTWRTVSSWTH